MRETRRNRFRCIDTFIYTPVFAEPGYYRENEFGVRLENVLEVIEKPWLHVSGQAMYGFKEVTLVPYEPKLIDFSLLSFYHVRHKIFVIYK